MDVVLPHIEFHYLHKLLLTAKHIYSLRGILGNFILKYPKAILGVKHDMVFAFINRM
jgi:hypothetical protein